MFLAFIFDKVAVKEYNEYVNGICKKELECFTDIVKYVEEHTGMIIDSPRTMFSLACTLAAQVNLFE